MLFMAVFQYDPSDRDELIRQRMEFDTQKAGVKIIGEWLDLSGQRVFCLFEAEDETHLVAAVFPWSNLGVVEIIPVMEIDKALKLYKKLAR